MTETVSTDAEAMATTSRLRILVAEDSAVTQDLLQQVLGQSGHEVEIAEDGPSALAALRAGRFDTALLDFNMPGMSGLQVVRAYLETSAGSERPNFIAITGDVRGLLYDSQDCEAFDKVLPKPLDIQSVVTAIADFGKARPRSAPTPLAEAQPRSRHASIEDLEFNFLNWPPEGQPPTDGALYDAVLVRHARDIARIWTTPGLCLLPVFDLSGQLGPAADLDGTRLAAQDRALVREVITGFADRRAALHTDVTSSDDDADRLLGRLFVSSTSLTPSWDGESRSLARYNTVADGEAVLRAAGRLTQRGLLTREFFDRTHMCGDCGSARLNLREVCAACGSAHLQDASYLHHFRCAFQGPEDDFRQGDDLICPKCRRALRHFGHDYDRPGLFVTCAACDAATSDPNIACVCTDCGTAVSGDAVATRDIHAYALSDMGRGYAEGGRAYLGLAQETLRFADLPLDFVIALNAAARDYTEHRREFVLLSFGYGNELALTREHGAAHVANLKALWLEIARQELPHGTRFAHGGSYDYALVRDLPDRGMERTLGRLYRTAEARLAQDPGVQVGQFGPKDLAR